MEFEITRNLRVSLGHPLSKNKKVEYYVRMKI